MMKKLWIPHGATMPSSPRSFPLFASNAIEATLQQLRKDSRWRRLSLGTFFLFSFAYVAVLSVSSSTCTSSFRSDGGGSAYCRVAAWAHDALSSTSTDSSRVSLPAGLTSSGSTLRGSTLEQERDISQGLESRTTTSIERVVFGIGGNAESWMQRSEYIKLWWKPGVTRGFVWMDRNLTTLKEGDPPVKVSEDTSRFSYTHSSNQRSALRISRIVTESFRLQLSNVDWFVMGDDDTLFFTDNLVKVLRNYDHRKFHYIGANSEDTRQSERHHYGLAFGGGGFAISYPLARALSEIQDECMERYSWLYGSDERVKACISELGVPLTKEPGFHQMDVHGDVTGLLAAHPVSPIVSLHHLDEFQSLFYGTTPLDAAKRLMKAAKADPGSLFQQSICYDKEKQWSVSVAWGYVVEVYEGFLTPRDLEIPATSFLSWAWGNDFDAFTMDTRPLPDVCNRPTRFFMVDAKTHGSGSKRVGSSSYDRLKEFESEGCSAKIAPMNSVKTIRVENKPVLEDWYQNPRRQCCSVRSMNSKSIKIMVGACGESESLVAGVKLIETMRKNRRLFH